MLGRASNNTAYFNVADIENNTFIQYYSTGVYPYNPNPWTTSIENGNVTFMGDTSQFIAIAFLG